MLSVERQSLPSVFLFSAPGFIPTTFLDPQTSDLIDNMLVVSSARTDSGSPISQRPGLIPTTFLDTQSSDLLQSMLAMSGGHSQPGLHTPPAVTDASIVKLNPGTALVLKKDHPTTVTTSAGNVICQKGVVALVFDNGRNVAIYSLDALSGDDVKMMVGDKLVKVLPGQEVVVTRDATADFTHINPGGGIAFKNPKATNLGNGIRAFHAEINIVSAVSALKPLRQMLFSNKPGDQKTVRQLIRNSVILMQM